MPSPHPGLPDCFCKDRKCSTFFRSGGNVLEQPESSRPGAVLWDLFLQIENLDSQEHFVPIPMDKNWKLYESSVPGKLETWKKKDVFIIERHCQVATDMFLVPCGLLCFLTRH